MKGRRRNAVPLRLLKKKEFSSNNKKLFSCQVCSAVLLQGEVLLGSVCVGVGGVTLASMARCWFWTMAVLYVARPPSSRLGNR